MLLQFVCGDHFMNCECESHEIESKAISFVNKKLGRTCKRGSGEKIDVIVKEFRIDSEGELKSRHYKKLSVNLPERELTEEECEAEIEEALKSIPKDFHGFIRSYAYELGHSSGYYSVINYINEIVSRIEEPIQSYEKTVLSKHAISVMLNKRGD